MFGCVEKEYYQLAVDNGHAGCVRECTRKKRKKSKKNWSEPLFDQNFQRNKCKGELLLLLLLIVTIEPEDDVTPCTRGVRCHSLTVSPSLPIATKG